jgi:myb proto-oncogene protein
MISKYDIKDRSGKKCRERWINHLKPEVIKSPWSPEEMKILFRCQAFYGNQWTEIAKFLPGRTDNSVKNYFYMTLRKRLRLFNKHVSPAERIEMPINDLSLNSELTQKVLNVDSQKNEKRTENR